MLDLRFTAKTFGAGVVTTALVLTIVLIAGNPHLSLLGKLELAASLTYISLLVNLAFVAFLLLVWMPIRAIARPSQADQRVFLVSGLIVLHLTWAILNRLTAVLTAILPPHFLIVPGLVQGLMLVLGGGCLVAASVWWRRRPRRRAVALGVTAIGLWAVCLLWHGALESRNRVYGLTDLQAAASADASESDPAPYREDGEQSPVLLLAFDGLSWNVMKPLLDAGRLPNFARLIRNGTIGYLDNGDLSYSPAIWSTIYSGRLPEQHGIHDFRVPAFRFSGETCPNLLVLPPTLHTFYGIRHLFGGLPNIGLWRLSLVGSLNRKVPMIWDVASRHQRRVAVVNPITSRPVQPVNGRMVILRRSEEPFSSYPPALAREWRQRIRTPGGHRGDWLEFYRNVGALLDQERQQVDFSVDLLLREPFDVGVLFTSVVDAMGHLGWAFFGTGEGLLLDLPSGLSDAEWEKLVLTHAEHPLFEAYQVLDNAIGVLTAEVDANYIVVSDHGWTFSGYEHYASPDGVVIFSGPDFKSGAVAEDVRIEDIAPTMLSLSRIPLSRELAGAVETSALRRLPRAAYVATYGPPRYPIRPVEGVSDPVREERLRALGYIQ